MHTPDEIKKGLEDTIIIYKSPCSNFVSEALQKVTANIAKEALAYIHQLETKSHQLERERDAAVDCLAMTKECKTCKHFSSHTASEEPCRYCGIRQNAWEWRGVETRTGANDGCTDASGVQRDRNGMSVPTNAPEKICPSTKLPCIACVPVAPCAREKE